jgi:hypothetical protein
MWRMLAVIVACCAASVAAQDRVLPLPRCAPALHSLAPTFALMRADELANPGMLWVERGERLWNAAAGNSARAARRAMARPRRCAESPRGIRSSTPARAR